MATAPKGNPKVVPIEEAMEDAAAPRKSKKKLFILIGAILLLVGGGGGAWYFMGQKEGEGAGHAAKKHEAPKPPVFVNMEPFTVNLQPENGDQYLQVQFTVQAADEKAVDVVKLYMPLLRSRVLLLLSSKKASEVSTPEGKQKLQNEIVAALKQPVTPQSAPQEINGVFFTSFVIQ